MGQESGSSRAKVAARRDPTGGTPVMRINLLSEVAAYPDRGHTDLLAGLQPLQRLFVAVLALTAGRPVGPDRLEEQLWGGFPPADPRSRLHACAYRVRAALRKAGTGHHDGDDLVTAHAGGYCLRVDSQSVDVHRFRAKAAQARAQAGVDDDVASLARDALGEWGQPPARLYGPEPLAGLPGRWAASYRLTLRREHRDLVIELLAAELRRGGAEYVLSEFARLADADEVAREDEQLTALLMRAYYQCGRQSEALTAYRRTAESLRRRGVDTGRELRMLEKKIRNQDPDMDYPRAVVIAPGDLVRADEGNDRDEADGESAAGTGPENPGEPGSRPSDKANRRPSYSQRNIGRTVIANQGTQHVNLGGSDE